MGQRTTGKAYTPEEGMKEKCPGAGRHYNAACVAVISRDPKKMSAAQADHARDLPTEGHEK